MTDSTPTSPNLTDSAARAVCPTIGQIVKRRRVELDLTVTELASRTGLARSYLYDIEKDRLIYPATDKLATLLRGLNLSADVVLADAGLVPTRAVLPALQPDEYLRREFGLSQEGIGRALEFIDHLRIREAQQPRVMR